MTKKKDNAVMFALAEVIDFEQARARREAAVQRKRDERSRIARKEAEREARLEQERRAQVEAAALEQQRCEQEHTRRAAAQEERFQSRVSDRLARIQAEGEVEIVRLRLEYAEREQLASRRNWLVPTLVVSLLALAGGLGYVYGVRPSNEPVVAERSQSVAATRPVRDRGAHGTMHVGISKAERDRADRAAKANLAKKPKPVVAPRTDRKVKRPGYKRPGKVKKVPKVKVCGRLGALGCIND